MRLLCCCCLSLCLYILGFAFFINRPLSLGVLSLEIQQKTARLAALPTPKLVILAGSNGPYSHACAVIGPMLNLPCENAGIAVGIGLDDVFARYAPALRAGDIVYMPMEMQQYIITHAQNDAGTDGAILLRHNRALLQALPPERILGAAFSSNFPDFLEALAEMPIAAGGFISPSATLALEYNAEGDRIGTSLATAKPVLLRHAAGQEPSAAAIYSGYGTRLIAGFAAAETRRGVVVIGGLPTDFATTSLPPETVAAIRSIYVQNGGGFVMLPGLSRYKPADFYDSEDHLAQPCQYLHSIAVARLLGAALHRGVQAPSRPVLNLAKTCP
jgi:hypothetical protein